MPLHLIQKDKDTEANILAIGAAMNACEGQFYFAEDTGKYYYGLTDGSLAGPITSVTASIPGPYSGDAQALANGVEIGEIYRLSEINDYDIPSPGARIVATRIE